MYLYYLVEDDKVVVTKKMILLNNHQFQCRNKWIKLRNQRLKRLCLFLYILIGQQKKLKYEKIFADSHCFDGKFSRV